MQIGVLLQTDFNSSHSEAQHLNQSVHERLLNSPKYVPAGLYTQPEPAVL